MRVAIIGAGYVGLVTGVCFAEYGNDVICIDTDENKIQRLNSGESLIYEPGLDAMLIRNLNSGRIKFTTNLKDSLDMVDFCFICVGTPPGEDGGADLNAVLKAAEDIGKYMTHHIYIIDKSTVPVGTALKVKDIVEIQLTIRNSNLTFDVISNPEFLKEGSAVTDCMRPERIIIGTDNEEAQKRIKELYLPFVRNSENYIFMDIKSAEMTKYVANAMLATKISFMNEMANLCEKIGADINYVRKGIGSDNRIGYHFIYAGCGYGGSCFPKDIKALIKMAEEVECSSNILKAVENVNSKQKLIIPQKVSDRFGDDLSGLVFAIWGLSFKPNTDDMREASSITIINELTRKGAKIKAYDPKAVHYAKTIYLKDTMNVEYYDINKYEALDKADALILVTEWEEFRSPDFTHIKSLLKQPIIFDGRNQYNKEFLNEEGFEYYQIGVGV